MQLSCRPHRHRAPLARRRWQRTPTRRGQFDKFGRFTDRQKSLDPCGLETDSGGQSGLFFARRLAAIRAPLSGSIGPQKEPKRVPKRVPKRAEKAPNWSSFSRLLLAQLVARAWVYFLAQFGQFGAQLARFQPRFRLASALDADGLKWDSSELDSRGERPQKGERVGLSGVNLAAASGPQSARSIPRQISVHLTGKLCPPCPLGWWTVAREAPTGGQLEASWKSDKNKQKQEPNRAAKDWDASWLCAHCATEI